MIIILDCREKILEYRDESQRLDQCTRLYDSSVSNEGLELDASHIVQVQPLLSFTYGLVHSCFLLFLLFLSVKLFELLRHCIDRADER